MMTSDPTWTMQVGDHSLTVKAFRLGRVRKITRILVEYNNVYRDVSTRRAEIRNRRYGKIIGVALDFGVISHDTHKILMEEVQRRIKVKRKRDAAWKFEDAAVTLGIELSDDVVEMLNEVKRL